MRISSALVALAVLATPWPAFADPLAPLPQQESADRETPADVLTILRWIGEKADNHGRPYLIIDKVTAEAFVFDSTGLPMGRTAVLIGSARGDTSVAGIGERKLADILPHERTTPSGRFLAKFGPAEGGEEVLWVDWNNAISIHPVVTGNKKERRLERLASPDPDDNRITYGCINVARDFYNGIIAPLVSGTEAIVYILPEERGQGEAFPMASSPLLGTP